MFVYEQAHGLEVLTVPAFIETGLVEHCFTTRTGGVSSGPFTELNLGFTVGDDLANVQENRGRVAHLMGFSLEHLIGAKQIHGNGIRRVSSSDRGRGALEYDTAIGDTDGLITDEIGVPLSTYHADCVPVYFLDTVTPAIGLAHAGWKGTSLQIAKRTMEEMIQAYGTEPANCLAAIGPSIGPCCYEVDIRVKKAFGDSFFDEKELFRQTSWDRWHLDLWLANQRIIELAGVPRDQIFSSRECTACQVDKFFSHRQEGGNTGRMGAFIMLRDRTTKDG